MSDWFETKIVGTGRLPLFCFFVAFVAGFGSIRLSARLIRAKVRWWPGNVVAGAVHVHHMVFGVVFMGVGGAAALAGLAIWAGRLVRARHRAGARRVRADTPPARRVLVQRGTAVDRRRVRRRRSDRLAADRGQPGRGGEERGQLPAAA